MITQNKQEQTLFNVKGRLEDFLDLSHPLCKLSSKIEWQSFYDTFSPAYSSDMGCPAKDIRLMVGLHYLKYTYDLSDEGVVWSFVENPYYQYFCGYEYFSHKPPIDPSSMTRFRRRLQGHKLESLLAETIRTGLKLKVITPKSFKRVNVDTTVQEKNIAFPTDSKLYYRMILRLVAAAKSLEIPLRQSYVRVAKRSLLQHGRYLHAKQFRRARKELKKLKGYLGRVYRDIQRNGSGENPVLLKQLALAQRLLKQEKQSKQKLYSLHEPDVACIAKGKSHKRYEFGSKASFTTTSLESFVVGALSFAGNPYDGHTLEKALGQSERIIEECCGKATIGYAYVDRGYKGHNYQGEAEVIIQQPRLKRKLTKAAWRYVKRRSAIEPIIGHMKERGRLGRNYLKGIEGDNINTLLAACGQNMRKLIRFLIAWIKTTLLLRNYNEKVGMMPLLINE